jgi:pimeloyl-ACP methyl ester carboxylesterase
MLGLCFAARFPTKARGLILIGCGTFDRNSRNLFLENLRQRMTEEDRRTLERIEREIDAPDHRLAAMGKVMQKVGSVELVCEVPAAQCCSAAYHQTWNDMLSMQRRRIYPAALKAIRVPVVMLHGKEDPHPGAAIRKCLSKWIPHLEYHEFPRAGHYPWLERHARGRFEKVLRERLRSFFP